MMSVLNKAKAHLIHTNKQMVENLMYQDEPHSDRFQQHSLKFPVNFVNLSDFQAENTDHMTLMSWNVAAKDYAVENFCERNVLCLLMMRSMVEVIAA